MKSRKNSGILLTLICTLILFFASNMPAEAANIKVDEKAKKIYEELSKIPKEDLKKMDKEKLAVYTTLENLHYHKLNEYYKLTLLFGKGNPEPSELFAGKNFVNSQKKLNAKFKKEYDYIEFCMQPLHYVGKYTQGDQFAVSKENINQKIEVSEGNFELITDIRAIQIDHNLFRRHIAKIDSGRKFNQRDFRIEKDTDAVNILLGNNYKKNYRMGDSLNLFLHGKNMKFLVVGFLEKGEEIPFDGKSHNLDNYIIMPFYDLLYSPADEAEKNYQSIYYSQKNAGYLKAAKNKSVEILQKDIAEINREYQLFLQLSDIPTKFRISN